MRPDADWPSPSDASKEFRRPTGDKCIGRSKEVYNGRHFLGPDGVLACKTDRLLGPDGVLAYKTDRLLGPDGVLAYKTGRLLDPDGVLACKTGRLFDPDGVLACKTDRLFDPDGVLAYKIGAKRSDVQLISPRSPRPAKLGCPCRFTLNATFAHPFRTG